MPQRGQRGSVSGGGGGSGGVGAGLRADVGGGGGPGIGAGVGVGRRRGRGWRGRGRCGRRGCRTVHRLRGVPGLLDRGDQIREAGPGTEGDPGLLGRVVDGGGDPVHPVQLLLDTGRARRAGHPADRELGLRALRCRDLDICCAVHVRTPETPTGPCPTSICWSVRPGGKGGGAVAVDPEAVRRPGRRARNPPRRRPPARPPRPGGPGRRPSPARWTPRPSPR